MATKTTCDKCGKVLTEYEQYKYEEYDLCEDCCHMLMALIENFIYPKED